MARIYALRVEVEQLHPAIWRGVEVPEDTTLAALHMILQRAMGWDNGALYDFHCAGARYGAIDHEELWRADPRAYDVRDVTLMQLLGESRRTMRYVYDPMSEAWGHTITLIGIYEAEQGVSYPRCVGGERHAPLRGVGGVTGYREVVRRWHARRDTQAPTLWPPSFNPEAFDAERVTFMAFEEIDALARASAGFQSVDLLSMFAAPAPAPEPHVQTDFERQVAAREEPTERAMPPEFISVDELRQQAASRLREGEVEVEDALMFLAKVASETGKPSNLHTRQLTLDALMRDPELAAALSPPRPEPDPAPEEAPEPVSELAIPGAEDPDTNPLEDVSMPPEEESLEASKGPSMELAEEPFVHPREADDKPLNEEDGAPRELPEEPIERDEAMIQGGPSPESDSGEGEEGTSEEVLLDEKLEALPGLLTMGRGLARLPVESLDMISTRLELEVDAPRRKDREEAIQAHLLTLFELDELLADLGAGEIAILEALLKSAEPILAEALTVSRSRDARFDGGGELGRLRRAGLCFVSLREGEAVVWLPEELRQLMGIVLS